MSALHYAPAVLAPIILMLWSAVTAYVLCFGLPNTGIHFDYILFTLCVLGAVLFGGAI